MKNPTFRATVTISDCATGETHASVETFNFYPNALCGPDKVQQAFTLNSAIHTACVNAGVVGRHDLVSITAAGVVEKVRPGVGYNDDQRFHSHEMMTVAHVTVSLLEA